VIQAVTRRNQGALSRKIIRERVIHRRKCNWELISYLEYAVALFVDGNIEAGGGQVEDIEGWSRVRRCHACESVGEFNLRPDYTLPLG